MILTSKMGTLRRCRSYVSVARCDRGSSRRTSLRRRANAAELATAQFNVIAKIDDTVQSHEQDLVNLLKR